MTTSPRALIIDDEVQLRRLLRIVLESKGYEVFEADSGTQGLSEAAFRRPDVILLDLGLPDIDGLDVLKKLREWTETPVLILSVRDQEDTKVRALESGADDYVTKPFSTAELIARLSVIQRRGKTSDDPVLRLGNLKIDFSKREVFSGEEALKLTPIEYDLLRMLARNAGRVLTRQQILTQIWGPNATEHGEYLRVYVTYLRRKIANSGIEIHNEPGIGYRLISEES